VSHNLHSKSINQIIDEAWDELVRDHKFQARNGKENIKTLIRTIERKIDDELSEMQSPHFTELDRSKLTRKKDCIIKEEIERYRQYYEEKSEKDAEIASTSKTLP